MALARSNIHSGRVQALIESRATPLFLARGSIAALTKALNEALSAAGVQGALHPNRLHTLLSNDTSRGVNDATLTLIETAADLAMADAEAVEAAAAAALAGLRAEAARLQNFTGASPEEIARRLSLPPAIALLVLGEEATAPTGPPLAPAVARTQEPDWSYQDVAVARCIEGFRRQPAAKLGLVLPTGGGKTRTALRTIIAFLDARPDETGPVYWVTHRHALKIQAHRELQKLRRVQGQLPPDAAALAGRIQFVMLGDLRKLMKPTAARPALIVIDEAHHAAAPSYALALNPPWPVPVLALTATPNRGDRLPIGIDEVAYTITYRELAERGAILSPTFLDFPVRDFDWSSDAIMDLADYLVDRTEAEFSKVLVLAPRIDRVEEFHAALVERLAREPGHILAEDDLGFVHGGGNSLRIPNEDFLDRFAAKPRAVLISAQLLLEGFDDPTIDTVVLTYPSSSMIRLMQAAGRAGRDADISGSERRRIIDAIAGHRDDAAFGLETGHHGALGVGKHIGLNLIET